jgi:hypothetical protein
MNLTFSSFDETQRANVNQLVDILSKDGFPQRNLTVACSLGKIKYIPNGANKMKAITLYLYEELEIPNLIEFLAIPRPDGLQQVVSIYSHPEPGNHQLTLKILESIKQVTIQYAFTLSPNPFVICNRISITPLNLCHSHFT